MEEAPCYVFKSRHERPTKRRRLNDTLESDIKQRHELFAQNWETQNRRLNEAINKSHDTTIDSIALFTRSASANSSVQRKIPTGLLVTGSSSSSEVFERAVSSCLKGGSNVCVTLSSSDGPNLKTLLKNLISRVTQEQGDASDDEEERRDAPSRGPKLLNYDLQILYDWCRLRDCQQIVIALNNSETFDANVLTDFVTLLHSWLDRLPVVLLIGIATSVDMFHDRTPAAGIKCMQGEAFDISETDHVLEEAFRSCTAAGGASLHMGPNLGSALLQRSKDYLQSVEAFRTSVKYAQMCHFYGNPATRLVDVSPGTCRKQDLDAIRHLPSFQEHVEQHLARKEAKKAHQLLTSDTHLQQELVTCINNTNTMLEWLCGALSIIGQLRQATSTQTSRPVPSFSSLYIKALSGHLGPSSPQIRELLLSIRILAPETTSLALEHINDTLLRMPPAENNISPDDFSDLHAELNELISMHGPLTLPNQPFATNTPQPAAACAPTKSTSTTPTPTATATATKTKAQIPTPAPISKHYNQLLTRLHSHLTTYFSSTLPTQPYTSLFLHELLFLDTKARTLHRSAMTPSPRTALERALSSPHDYLGCICCDDSPHSPAQQQRRPFNSAHDGENATHQAGSSGISGNEGSTHPPTALLYQLYNEAGSLINVGDLWTAFRARIAPAVGRATKTALQNTLHDTLHDSLHDTRHDTFQSSEMANVQSDDADDEMHAQAGAGAADRGDGGDGDAVMADAGTGSGSGHVSTDETLQRALFFRALAELKYLGMVKTSRRKVDCVQKVMWKGL